MSDFSSHTQAFVSPCLGAISSVAASSLAVNPHVDCFDTVSNSNSSLSDRMTERLPGEGSVLVLLSKKTSKLQSVVGFSVF